MRLTGFADFGLRTLILLADRDGETLSASDIADHFGVSRHNIPPFIPTLIQPTGFRTLIVGLTTRSANKPATGRVLARIREDFGPKFIAQRRTALRGNRK